MRKGFANYDLKLPSHCRNQTRLCSKEGTIVQSRPAKCDPMRDPRGIRETRSAVTRGACGSRGIRRARSIRAGRSTCFDACRLRQRRAWNKQPDVFDGPGSSACASPGSQSGSSSEEDDVGQGSGRHCLRTRHRAGARSIQIGAITAGELPEKDGRAQAAEMLGGAELTGSRNRNIRKIQ